MRTLIVLIVAIALSAGLMTGSYLVIERRIAGHAEDLQNADEKLAALGAIAKQAEHLYARKSTLERRLKAIDMLSQNRGRVAAVLKEIASRMPENVWMSEFSENLGRIMIRGFGPTSNDVSQLLSNLQASPLFASAALTQVQTAVFSGQGLFQYEIEIQIGRVQ